MLYAYGADASGQHFLVASGRPAALICAAESLLTKLRRQIRLKFGWTSLEEATACIDELIERGETMSTEDIEAFATLLLQDNHRDVQAIGLQVCGLILSRWPLDEPPLLLEPDSAAPLPWAAALAHARRRLAVLQGGRGAGDVQRGLMAAFLGRVRDACGGAVAPAFAPFARLRFVAAGGLERAWAWERARGASLPRGARGAL